MLAKNNSSFWHRKSNSLAETSSHKITCISERTFKSFAVAIGNEIYKEDYYLLVYKITCNYWLVYSRQRLTRHQTFFLRHSNFNSIFHIKLTPCHYSLANQITHRIFQLIEIRTSCCQRRLLLQGFCDNVYL